MSDELARLEAALGATSPRAPASVRARAVSEAMAAFERHHQESAGEARHRGRVPMRGTSWIRRLAMSLSRPSLAFAGTAAVVVVAGIVSHQVLMTPPAPPAPVESTASMDPADTAPGRSPAPAQAASAEAVGVAPPSSPVIRGVPTQGGGSRPRTDEARMRADEAVPARSVGESGGLLSLPGIASAPKSMERSTRPPAHDPSLSGVHAQRGDRFAELTPNPVKLVAEAPVSTFSIDVDTASYAYLRAALNAGWLPETDTVRTEELVNYFPYDYAPPETRDAPFAAHVSVMPAPWNAAARLLHIGIKGYALDRAGAPRANLVFLVDTSGSMDAPEKLPLLVRSFKLLLGALALEDRVAIVAYAGSAGVVLEPTLVADRSTILASLDRLGAGGSTAGAEGIRAAYRLAERHFVEGGVNRVILATDGDFNVGLSDPNALEDYIARKRETGVSLSVLGFGRGNYNDALMQRLAQHGNGNAAYIDSLSEARKVLLEEAASTLVTIATDVKVQVEFNPAAVREYRLIGYETRMLAREDFRNDRVDAGEIGAGHTVTALYELTSAGADGGRIAPLRYQREGAEPVTDFDGELAYLKIRYKRPDAETSTLITRAVTAADAFASVDDAPRDVRFAAAVAAFGELLRGGRYTGDYGYDDVAALAQGARGEDPFGYRNEFVRLVRLAESLVALED